MKKNKTAKVFAILALFGIILSIVGTGILVFMTPTQEANPQLTEEQLQEYIKEFNVENDSGVSNTGVVNTGIVETGTGEIK